MSDDTATVLTLKEYAAAMRVHPQTVRKWIRQGKIVPERIGTRGHWRFRVIRVALATTHIWS